MTQFFSFFNEISFNKSLKFLNEILCCYRFYFNLFILVDRSEIIRYSIMVKLILPYYNNKSKSCLIKTYFLSLLVYLYSEWI